MDLMAWDARGACGLCGSGQPKAVTEVGNGGRFATPLCPNVSTDRFAIRRKRISLRGRWRQKTFFWLRLIRAENRIFVAASGFNDVSSHGNPDVSS
jgi:hypothetical protein